MITMAQEVTLKLSLMARDCAVPWLFPGRIHRGDDFLGYREKCTGCRSSGSPYTDIIIYQGHLPV